MTYINQLDQKFSHFRDAEGRWIVGYRLENGLRQPFLQGFDGVPLTQDTARRIAMSLAILGNCSAQALAEIGRRQNPAAQEDHRIIAAAFEDQ